MKKSRHDPQNPFFHKSFISIDQITHPKQIAYLFSHADRMKKVVETNKIYEPLKGKTIAILFYQPSTRTFTSFLSTAQRLGAYVVPVNDMTSVSSTVKGESLEDTIRTIEQTTAADLIILRHPANDSSEIAGQVSTIPIVNAGSGTAEHPTQALLDLYTIYNKFGRVDNLNIAMVGDLKYGRTIKSLAKLLTVAGKKNTITFVSPKELTAPKDLIEELSQKATVYETADLADSLTKADVLYMTRVQKEWFEKEGIVSDYERLKTHFFLSNALVDQMKPDSIVLHPLPRAGEIKEEVDNNPRAYYFEQMRSGLYIRMAILELILNEEL